MDNLATAPPATATIPNVYRSPTKFHRTPASCRASTIMLKPPEDMTPNDRPRTLTPALRRTNGHAILRESKAGTPSADEGF